MSARQCPVNATGCCAGDVAALCVQTNNPRKMDVLTQLGVKITGRIPCQVAAGQYNEVCLL
jgi:GTP cyclohydrolase II